MSTIENFTDKNETVYTQFYNAAQENPQKVGELNRKVIRIKQHSDSIYNYIGQLKEMLVKRADGPEGNVNNIKLKEDLNSSGELMIAMKNGTRLKGAIETYKDSLIKIFDPRDSAQIESVRKCLDTSAPPVPQGIRPTWEVSKFEGYPLIAVITLMSKMQSDIRNSEADAINYLHAKIDATSFKFNKLKAQVIAKSDYVLQGDNYEARVFLSAIDTTAVPEIFVTGGGKLDVKPGDNAGIYTARGNNEGPVKWSGYIKFKTPSGKIDIYPFEEEYQVSKPSATVSATKMNVIYKGLANPISISAPGISSRDLRVSMTKGRITQAGNNFLAYPEASIGDTAVVTVTATVDNVVKLMGIQKFRIKLVPPPIAIVADKGSGTIDKNLLLLQQAVFAKMVDFDFDMKFSIQSFLLSGSRGSSYFEIKSEANRFSKTQMDFVRSLNTGSKILISNIVAKGEDGTTRDLPPISLQIN
jgi:gliding motility-associated protein GldM